MSTIKVNSIVPPNAGEGVSIDGLQMPTAGAFSNRNMIINGAMTVAQRATSLTVTTGGYVTVDRWRYTQAGNYGVAVSPTISKSTDVPNNLFNYSYKLEAGTGATPTASQYHEVDTFLEGQNVYQLAQGTSDAKNMTLSFWVKASTAGTYCASIGSVQPYSTGRKRVAEYTINSANTWEYKVITIAGDTGGAWNRTTNAIGLSICFTLAAGSDKQGTKDTWLNSSTITCTNNQTNLTATTGATWFLTGVQLEVGSKATPFEHEGYGQTLAKCQRYFYRKLPFLAHPVWLYGNDGGSTQIPFPTEMRANPTFSYSGTLNSTILIYYGPSTAYRNFTTLNATVTSPQSARINVTGISPTVTAGYSMGLYVNTNAYLNFNAEL